MPTCHTNILPEKKRFVEDIRHIDERMKEDVSVNLRLRLSKESNITVGHFKTSLTIIAN